MDGVFQECNSLIYQPFLLQSNGVFLSFWLRKVDAITLILFSEIAQNILRINLRLGSQIIHSGKDVHDVELAGRGKKRLGLEIWIWVLESQILSTFVHLVAFEQINLPRN